MFRMILLAAMFAVSVAALATSAGAIGSASTGAGAGKVTFDEAYDDSEY
jgi:hypothetical protein